MKTAQLNEPGMIIAVCALLTCAVESHGDASDLKRVESILFRRDNARVTSSGGRVTRDYLEGETHRFKYLKVQAVTLDSGFQPEEPHANRDHEECIFVLDGEMTFTLNDTSEVLEAGSVVLLMPRDTHSIENTGNGSLTYVVMQYRSRDAMDFERGHAAGGSTIYNIKNHPFEARPWADVRNFFDRQTVMCKRFELHVTRLKGKTSSHDPHTHRESEFVLMISGETEMHLGGRDFRHGTAGDLYFMGAGVPHGIANSIDQPCSYFAFKWE